MTLEILYNGYLAFGFFVAIATMVIGWEFVTKKIHRLWAIALFLIVWVFWLPIWFVIIVLVIAALLKGNRP